MIGFLNMVTKADNSKKSMTVIVLATNKAFDSVSLYSSHESQELRYNNHMPAWRSSWFNFTVPVVSVTGTLSKPCTITSGVIPGSVLSPLLFLLYINNVFQIVSHGIFLHKNCVHVLPS